MDIFVIKLIITPALMLMVSLIIRKWGGFIGGMVAGLPLTSGPIAIFLAVEQGPVFAAHSAAAALCGLAAVLLTWLGYLLAANRLPLWIACISALVIFVISSALFLQFVSPERAMLISLLLITAIICLTIERDKPVQSAPARRWDIPLRMLIATIMLFAVTESAHLLGPELSGILAPVPVIAWPLTVFATVQGGKSEMSAMVRGNAISAAGVMAFYCCVREMILAAGLVITFSVAVIVSILLTLIVVRLTRRFVGSPPLIAERKMD